VLRGVKMENKRGLDYILSLMCVVFFISAFSIAWGVSVLPNKAVVYGTVVEYCLTSSSLSGIKPEQVLNKLVISIAKVEDVKNYPNFLKDKEGRSLTFYLKEKPVEELFEKKIKAIVDYKGDERGGILWIKHIEIVK